VSSPALRRAAWLLLVALVLFGVVAILLGHPWGGAVSSLALLAGVALGVVEPTSSKRSANCPFDR